MIWAEILTGLSVIGFVYAFLRNFKTDMKDSFSALERRMDRSDERITSLEERMFLMATGKTLAEAILIEKMKRVGKEQE